MGRVELDTGRQVGPVPSLRDELQRGCEGKRSFEKWDTGVQIKGMRAVAVTGFYSKSLAPLSLVPDPMPPASSFR